MEGYGVGWIGYYFRVRVCVRCLYIFLSWKNEKNGILLTVTLCKLIKCYGRKESGDFLFFYFVSYPVPYFFLFLVSFSTNFSYLHTFVCFIYGFIYYYSPFRFGCVIFCHSERHVSFIFHRFTHLLSTISQSFFDMSDTNMNCLQISYSCFF